jgi:hypothetical protein
MIPLTIEEIRENNEIELYYINRMPENFMSHFIYEFADITAYIAVVILILI